MIKYGSGKLQSQVTVEKEGKKVKTASKPLPKK